MAKLTRKEKRELKIKERADLLLIVLNNNEIYDYFKEKILDYFKSCFDEGEEITHLIEENNGLTFEEVIYYCTLFFDSIEIDEFVVDYIDTFCKYLKTISTEEAIETLLNTITDTEEIQTELKQLYNDFLIS